MWSAQKKYIAVGSETAGSQGLRDGGMFSVHNGPSPHRMQKETHKHRAARMKTTSNIHIIV